jgi:peptidoglycan/xylan/chitin deacetylase (PgdA/CDA1 family)
MSWQGAGSAQAFFGTAEYVRDRQKNARAIPVLTYHRIVEDEIDQNNVTVQSFRDQMFTLKRQGWSTITLKEYGEFLRGTRELPEKSILITFDDGAKESFYPVAPVFGALGFTGVNYIIANAAGIQESTYYLSRPEIQRMIRRGQFEIGSHSFDGHRPYQTDMQGGTGIFFADKLWTANLGRLETDEEFRQRVHDDLTRARKELERTYGVIIDTFAFPLGNETGISGAANFAKGASITEEEAEKVYSIGFLQTDNRGYSFNYPNTEFLSYRIHVYHDWDGARLLQELEQGLPKDLPFSDDFRNDTGWISAWGEIDIGRNNFVLTPDSGASGASAFLDGTKDWDSYSYDASLNWQEGYVFLLADVVDSKTYHTCAFGSGIVRIQKVVNGVATTLAELRDEQIEHGSDVRAGIRVHDAVIECTWNYKSILETYERQQKGGVGIQIWNPEAGSGTLQVSEILVRPYEATQSATSTTEE